MRAARVLPWVSDRPLLSLPVPIICLVHAAVCAKTAPTLKDMLKSPFPYFLVIAAVVFGSVDYFSQAKLAGSRFGSYPLAAYMDDVKTRLSETRDTIDAAREKSQRQSVLAKMHLPDAPEGWMRREWEPGLNDRYLDGSETELEQEVLGAMDESAPMLALNKIMNDKHRRRAREEVWEYVGPEGTIRLSARYRPQAGRILSEKITTDPRSAGVESKFGIPKEFGTIRGVTYYVATRDFLDSSGTFPGASPVHLIAPMGRDIKLAAFVETAPETFVQLLEQIDYDALNAMLDEPLTGVGLAAPVLSDQARQALMYKIASAVLVDEAQMNDFVASQAANFANADRLAASRSGEGGGGSTFIERLFGKSVLNGDAKAKGDEAKDGGPKRLKLSGGSSCLDGSKGALCKK